MDFQARRAAARRNDGKIQRAHVRRRATHRARGLLEFFRPRSQPAVHGIDAVRGQSRSSLGTLMNFARCLSIFHAVTTGNKSALDAPSSIPTKISGRSLPLDWQMPEKAGDALECDGNGTASLTSPRRSTSSMNSLPHISQFTEDRRSEISSAPRCFRPRAAYFFSRTTIRSARTTLADQGFGNIGAAPDFLKFIRECDLSAGKIDQSQNEGKSLHICSSRCTDLSVREFKDKFDGPPVASLILIKRKSPRAWTTAPVQQSILPWVRRLRAVPL